jgi:heat shock protein HslJ
MLSLIVFVLCAAGCRTQKKGEASSPEKDTNSQLTDVYWKLTELSDEPVPAKSDGSAEAHLTFRAEGNGVFGNGGCNSFRGTYALTPGNGIRFSPMVSTLKMCLDAETENKLKHVFETAERYELKSDTLILYKDGAVSLARFVAIQK